MEKIEKNCFDKEMKEIKNTLANTLNGQILKLIETTESKKTKYLFEFIITYGS